MIIKKVTDREFAPYGKVIEGIDFSPILKVLEDISCGENVEYVASYQPLEEPPLRDLIRDNCFGELAIEIGYCAGRNHQLNALEYHRTSEINVAATDIILLLGKQGDIDADYKYSTDKVEAFFVPEGTAVELYATTLHFAPCGLKKNDYAFKTAVVLPYGTNFDKKADFVPVNQEDALYFAKNKWLIAHPEGGQEGAYIGLTGENIVVEEDLPFGPDKKLGFGLMRLPLLEADEPTKVDLEQVKDMVDIFMEQGFTYFDTAYMYHGFTSEKVMRECLVERYPRQAFTVADKMPVVYLKKEEDLERIFNEQLEKCGVEYFDYYLLHNLGVKHYKIAQDLNAFAFIQKKKEEGKIRHIGFSFHDTADVLEEILTAHEEVEFVQLQMNYLDWDSESIQSRKCYEVAKKHGKAVIVMEPVKGGTLASVPEEAEKMMKEYHPELSVASWAIRFSASREGILAVLSGMSDLTQLKDNIGYMKDFQPFNEEEENIVKQTVEIIHRSIAIPCTACQYCVEGCPKNIPIPKYFSLYNAEKHSLNKQFSAQNTYYGNYIKTYGKASDCIECRNCESNCPQHLEITKYLKEVAAVFEGK